MDSILIDKPCCKVCKLRMDNTRFCKFLSTNTEDEYYCSEFVHKCSTKNIRTSCIHLLQKGGN